MKVDELHYNKTVLITGASCGIGYQLAKLFAKDGYDLVLVARNKLLLENISYQLKILHGTNSLIISKDLSLPTAALEIYQELNNQKIQVDVLVNNAGFNVYGPFSETDWQKELEMLQVNLITLTHLTKLFLPMMIERQSGKILNVGSTGSFAPGVFNSVYCATKAFVLSFSEAIAEELRGSGVTVTTLCPGFTKTEFAKRANMINVFPNNAMSSDKVAKVGYNALMKTKTSVVAGFANKFTIFSLRLMPRNLVASISRYMMSGKKILMQ